MSPFAHLAIGSLIALVAALAIIGLLDIGVGPAAAALGCLP